MSLDDFMQTMGWVFCGIVAIVAIFFAVVGVATVTDCGWSVADSMAVKEVCSQ